jgi:hypothetical protein
VARSLVRSYNKQQDLKKVSREWTEEEVLHSTYKANVVEMVSKKFPGTLVKSACVWPAAFFSNYMWIPTNVSPFFMNTVAVTWVSSLYLFIYFCHCVFYFLTIDIVFLPQSAIMSNAGTAEKKA